MLRTMWRPIPISLTIMSILEKRDGVILEADLLRLLEQKVGTVSISELNAELMNLEIQGKISVLPVKKNTRKITQVRDGQFFLAIGED